jgi:hypothetical protein
MGLDLAAPPDGHVALNFDEGSDLSFIPYHAAV